MSMKKDIALECISMRKAILSKGDVRMSVADHKQIAEWEKAIDEALDSVSAAEYLELRVALGDDRDNLLRTFTAADARAFAARMNSPAERKKRNEERAGLLQRIAACVMPGRIIGAPIEIMAERQIKTDK